jgi:hypothetical protein
MSWIACATTSLPVPLSPVTSTVPWLAATADSCSFTRCIAGESPISRSSPRRSPEAPPLPAVFTTRRTAFSRTSFRCPSPRLIAMISSSPSKGFCT